MPVCEEIDGEDEEIVMTVLGSLEDLLYEPISIGGGDSSDSSDDDAWNSCESKEGHSLRDEIATFADRAIAADDDAGEEDPPGLLPRPQARALRDREPLRDLEALAAAALEVEPADLLGLVAQPLLVLGYG